MSSRLGNNGFAITGILYTLFFLFLMILLSVLAGLSSRKSMLEKSTEILEKSFLGTKVTEEDFFNSDYAKVTGKYVFESNEINLKCIIYLNKGESLKKEEIIDRFVPADCKEYNIANMELKEIYSFE